MDDAYTKLNDTISELEKRIEYERIINANLKKRITYENKINHGLAQKIESLKNQRMILIFCSIFLFLLVAFLIGFYGV